MSKNPSSQKTRKNLELKLVGKSNSRFLYELLQERNPVINISHKKMPTYKQHIKFVNSKPYSKWYIIFYNNKKSGTIYLSKQDEVGLFIKKEMQGLGIGQKALKLLMEYNPRERYLANTNPKNKNSIKFFKKNGFMLLQHTFELTTPRVS